MVKRMMPATHCARGNFGAKNDMETGFSKRGQAQGSAKECGQTECGLPGVAAGAGGGDMQEILAENARRREAEHRAERFDPATGVGASGAARRVWRRNPFTGIREFIPRSMADDPATSAARTAVERERVRCRHDFDFWAWRCARIKHKTRPEIVPFVLNRGQRRVAEALEADRAAGRPMRLIVLKARQWGCSTVVEMYMAWVQCCLARNWHSLLCSQVQSVSQAIRDMLTVLLDNYPPEMWEGDGDTPRLRAFQGQQTIREIEGRSCHLTLATSESVNSVRGSDYAMAHLTEVAFWKDTPTSRPLDFIRSIYGSVARTPLTLIVMESTANGAGSFFHREWLRSAAGKSDKHAVFVPWYEIDIYREEVTDAAALWQSIDGYERALWSEHGLTLERIAWYHAKRAEMADHAAFMAEYPTTAEEAFAMSGNMVFAPAHIEAMRAGCSDAPLTGEVCGETPTGHGALRAVRFTPDPTGALKIWRLPEAGHRYVAAVDVGGRTLKADWSVIAVLSLGPRPEVVAQWRGHTDHDLLVWKAASIATYYNSAILAFESNSLEHAGAGMAPDQGAYFLDQLADVYPNLYYRQSAGEDTGRRPGFHTNRATKQMIITGLIAAVRDGTYTERDAGLLDELASYRLQPNGVYEAADRCHDDILMTRAIALYVASRPGNAQADADLERYLSSALAPGFAL